MATEVLELSVKTNIGETTQSMASLNAQLKEAQQEVQELSDKFGATSKAAVEAAKKAADLAKRIGDAKALTDAFNPDAKFRALSGALQGVAGGFAVVQGALGSMGVESEEVEKSMLKVQSAMAMAQGAQAIGESVNQFKNLGTVIKSTTVFQKASAIAQRVWNAAMAANPLGAIIVAITALIASGALLIKFFKSSSAEAKANTLAIEANAKALKKQREETEKANIEFERKQKQEIAMAKAQGASTVEVRKLEKASADLSIQRALESRETAKLTLETEKNRLANLKKGGVIISEEDLKKQQDAVNESIKEYNKLNQAVKKASDFRIEQNDRHLIEIATANTNANKKEVSGTKETGDTKAKIQKEIDDARIQAAKDLEAELKDIRDEAANQLILDEAALLDSFAESQLTEQQREQNAIYEKYNAIITAKEKNGEDILELETNLAKEIAAVQEKYGKESADKEKDRKKALQSFNVGMAQQGLGIIADAAGEGTALAKAAAIAQATISGVQGVQNAFTSANANIPATASSFGAYPVTMAALAGVFAAANIAKIASGGGGGVTPPSTPPPSTTTPAPQMMSGAFELGGGIKPEPMKAFVVTDEMSNSQSQLANIRRRATI
jgi:DNA repair exonuclease SbcCD ATPase subunit